MKKTKYLLLILSAFIVSVAMAQTKSAKPATTSAAATGKDTTIIAKNGVAELSALFYKDVKFQAAKGVGVVGVDDAKKMLDYVNSDAVFKAKRDKLYGGNYTKPVVITNISGESERIKWLRGIPVPKHPEVAFYADKKENSRYGERVEKYVEGLKGEVQKWVKSTDLMQTYEQGGTEAVKKKYEDQANKSEMIQKMGGAEKLQTMSEKERQEAAKKMVSEMTGGYTVEELQKMTPEQKKALAQKMAGQKMQERQAQGGDYRNVDHKAIDDAKEAKMINDWQAKFYEDIKKDVEPIGKLALQYEQQEFAALEALSNWASAAVSKLPIVRDSEYGPRRDGIEFVDYTLAYMSYLIGRDKLSKDREIWEKTVRVHVTAFQKLDAFYATYKDRKNMTDNLKLALAGLVTAGYESILDLNKQAGFWTNRAAGLQGDYNCKVLRSCGDPK